MAKTEFADYMKELSVLANRMPTEMDDFNVYNKMRQIARRLSHIIDEKDAYSKGHSERKALYAASIARQLGLEPVMVETVQIVSFLHEIGKMWITNDILQKRGQLDSIELKEMQKHPLIGERILTPSGLTGEILQAIRYHHESPDGTGYPDGLKGDEIPLEARIVKVADALTAMIEQRPYRNPLSLQQAMEEMIKLSGQGFDTQVVQALIKVIEAERKRRMIRPSFITPPTSRKILVVNENEIKSFLDNQGFETVSAKNGQEALQMVFETFPNLILLSKAINDISPYQLCRRLKNDPRTNFLPIIVLSKRKKIGEEVTFLNEGADDYLIIPSLLESERLVARIKSHTRQKINEVSVNPLTGLTEGFFIEERIKMCLSKKMEEFAILFIDLDKFRVFNQYFGFLKGDSLLKLTAQIMAKAVEEAGDGNDLIGHRGGDDFIIITTPDRVDAICKRIILDFDAQVKHFYSQEEKEHGYITLKKEAQKNEIYPIITISIGVVSNREEELNDYYQIEEKAAYALESAKEIQRSIYYY